MCVCVCERQRERERESDHYCSGLCQCQIKRPYACWCQPCTDMACCAPFDESHQEEVITYHFLSVYLIQLQLLTLGLYRLSQVWRVRVYSLGSLLFIDTIYEGFTMRECGYTCHVFACCTVYRVSYRILSWGGGGGGGGEQDGSWMIVVCVSMHGY